MGNLLADHELHYIESIVSPEFDVSGFHFANMHIEVDRERSEVIAAIKMFGAEKSFAVSPNDTVKYASGTKKYYWTHEEG